MNIKFEWKYGNGSSKEGIARFKVGENHHVINFDSYNTAAKVHQLLVRAYSAGEALGAGGVEKERQRVADWLTVGA